MKSYDQISKRQKDTISPKPKILKYDMVAAAML